MDGSTKLLIGLAVLVWGLAGYLYATQDDRRGADVAVSPAATNAPPLPALAVSAAASGTVTSLPTQEAPPEDPEVCVVRHLPSATFEGKKMPLGFICEEGDPHRGATELKSRIVKAGLGSVTPGMRFWAGLGWYEMAAYSVLRARCCKSKPALSFRFPLACPLDQALRDLEWATTAADEAAIGKALDDYRARALCLARAGQGGPLGQTTAPGTGRQQVEQLLDR